MAYFAVNQGKDSQCISVQTESRSCSQPSWALPPRFRQQRPRRHGRRPRPQERPRVRRRGGAPPAEGLRRDHLHEGLPQNGGPILQSLPVQERACPTGREERLADLRRPLPQHPDGQVDAVERTDLRRLDRRRLVASAQGRADLRRPLIGALYSADVPNLLMGSRCESITHIALGSMRLDRRHSRPSASRSRKPGAAPPPASSKSACTDTRIPPRFRRRPSRTRPGA